MKQCAASFEVEAEAERTTLVERQQDCRSTDLGEMLGRYLECITLRNATLVVNHFSPLLPRLILALSGSIACIIAHRLCQSTYSCNGEGVQDWCADESSSFPLVCRPYRDSVDFGRRTFWNIELASLFRRNWSMATVSGTLWAI